MTYIDRDREMHADIDWRDVGIITVSVYMCQCRCVRLVCMFLVCVCTHVHEKVQFRLLVYSIGLQEFHFKSRHIILNE